MNYQKRILKKIKETQIHILPTKQENNVLRDTSYALAYWGQTYNVEKLLQLANKSGENLYIVECHNFPKELLARFDINTAIHDIWKFTGDDVCIFIITEDNKIKSCAIDKCKYIRNEYGNMSVKVLQPTEIEITVFMKIMDYITTLTDQKYIQHIGDIHYDDQPRDLL